MLSKLLDSIPARYRWLTVATVTAISIPLIGLAVHFTLPNAAVSPPDSPGPTAAKTSEAPESPARLTITPIAPPPPGSMPASPVPVPDSAPLAPIQNPPQIEEYAAQYENPAGIKYGHFPYDEAYGGDIESIGMFTRESYEREEYLHYEAAAAFESMKAAAAADAIKIQAISGFRTVARQADLFAAQVAKLGSEAAAAKLSAPPGHSEHHTGYAVDIGDVTLPKTDITYDFEYTPAYSWLKANAGRFGFEESFFKGNPQGVSFEPWHWRFIGSEEAARIFGLSRPSP
ncbi:D-alanyl-D-alanine carboxypeptidase family protein [cf. Phormidesmis sp. LEGE 11477]|uniref:M15 family metallopeptidase n=1 Tax=cf. Phormidesmis sp. LEGE 11477 TaxID=1828680 RepID=UPI001881B6A3|nr:M15 family metallopeptidase [cf. Phormidesmis sp. LEGE 11477]MBE9061277.1 M15 family metallopeptidase [cf. Phormidesmis sp. LEGE 11477]